MYSKSHFPRPYHSTRGIRSLSPYARGLLSDQQRNKISKRAIPTRLISPKFKLNKSTLKSDCADYYVIIWRCVLSVLPVQQLSAFCTLNVRPNCIYFTNINLLNEQTFFHFKFTYNKKKPVKRGIDS